MPLTLQITKPSGNVIANPLTSPKTTINLVSGDKVRIIDDATGKSPPQLRVRKSGDALLVDGLPDGQVVELSNFYSACTPSTSCQLTVDGAGGGVASVITPADAPLYKLADGSVLVHAADGAAGAAGGGTAGSGFSPLTVLAGVAGIGVIAAAAGGGGGGGGGSSNGGGSGTGGTGSGGTNGGGTTADTTPPTVPAAAIDANGKISGTAEPGATVTLSVGGAVVATTTAAAGSGAFAFANPVFVNHEAISVIATDAAGNASGAASLAGLTAVVATGAGVTLGGSGADYLLGGAGADVLIGGGTPGLRNGQFEFWNTRTGGGYSTTPTAGEYSFFSEQPSGIAPIGWTPLATAAAFGTVVPTLAGSGDTARQAELDAWAVNGGPGPYDDLQLMGNLLHGGGASVVYYKLDATSAAGSHYVWNTNFGAGQAGSGLTQTIATAAGEDFALSMTVSGLDGSQTSFRVLVDGVEVGRYDGITHTWASGTAPVGFDVAALGAQQTWTWIAHAASSTSTITIEAYVSPNSNFHFSGVPDPGVDVHRIAVGPVIADGGDLLVGGAGVDILYGQGGDDVLVGQSYDPATGVITTDAAANVFVYTMQADNGNDVIKDFRVGVDRIALIDVLDVDRAGSLAPTYLGDSSGTAYADTNLSAADLSVANGQRLVVSTNNAGNVVLQLFGADNAALGSVTLEGVTVGPGGSAGNQLAAADLASLYSGDVLLTTMDGFAADRLLNYSSGSAILA